METINGVTKPHVDDTAYFHPNVDTFIPTFMNNDAAAMAISSIVTRRKCLIIVHLLEENALRNRDAWKHRKPKLNSSVVGIAIDRHSSVV